jgi:hypothetical protein
MNLVIVGGLCEPPTESLPFRHLTLISKENLALDVLVECPKEFQDFYFKYMQKMGVFDYIDDIIYPEFQVNGIRLDIQKHQPYTIVTDRITFVNFNEILGQIIHFQNIQKKYLNKT